MAQTTLRVFFKLDALGNLFSLIITIEVKIVSGAACGKCWEGVLHVSNTMHTSNYSCVTLMHEMHVEVRSN